MTLKLKHIFFGQRKGNERQLSITSYLAWLFFVAVFLLAISRVIFYAMNPIAFGQLGFVEVFRLLFIGLRFDLSALALLNLPAIILLTIPFTCKFNKHYQNFVLVIAMIVNGLAILLNLIDTIYFRYISKRTTFELFQFFGNGKENIDGLLFQFIQDFWYMVVILLIMIVLLYRFFIFFSIRPESHVKKPKWYLVQTCFFVLSLAVATILFRGGLQLKPISLITAANYTSSQNVPLLINSPFSVIKTLNNKNLPKLNFYEETLLDSIYTPVHQKLDVNKYVHDSSFQNANVVILILESFSRDYIGFYDTSFPTFTPFLDSLLAQSISFKGFANGRRSIEGLPSILSGIPSLMNIDYPSSQYVNNKVDGLGTLLLKKGYHTSFFHGGNNGTMSFDSYARSVGFTDYYGRNEYDNEADFDGKWGIFDTPFLQFVARKFNSFQQPFASAIFTLSSHHPYTIPLADKDLLNISANPIEASIRYSDRSLKMFFATSSKMPWFRNTIFIITADHTAEEARSEINRSSLGIYAIPIAFYLPGKHLEIATNETAQQIDVLPSCMALLGYKNDAVFSFGRNVFDSISVPFTVNFINGVYQYYDGKYLLKHDGEHALGFFDIGQDPLMQTDQQKRKLDETNHSERILKAMIQQYNNRLINNCLYIK